MKQTKKAITCLLAVGLMTIAAAITASASTPAPPTLTGQLVLRPLTPGDVTNYKLPSTTEVSGGLNTVGVGTPVYLEAEVNSAIPASNIVSVTWTLTNRPAFSTAVLTSSPLGTNVPVYDPSQRQKYQVAPVNGRMLLRADLAGQYTVVATIVSSSYGSTNVTQTITAGTYMGIATCALCHSGGAVAENKFTSWQNTAHARIFTDGINGGAGTTGPSCFKCHTVGYDVNTNAVNGGFDDVATQLGWTWPKVLAPTNWAYMQAVYPSLANLANIQCENCHGPGSQHAYSLGNTNFISVTVSSGDCNQCHDAPTHHVKGTQWLTSRHALTTGPTSANCSGCHSAVGFIARMNGESFTNKPFAALSCQACHEPHGSTTPTNNPHLLRNLAAVTMADGTVITNAGFGAICLECHQNRNGSATNQLVKYPIGQLTWFGGSSFGVHDNPQGDMIEGLNANTYGQTIPSAAHRTAVTNLCVGCHMQTADYGDPAYLQAGGHTFGMTYNVVTTNGLTLVTNSMDKVDVCVQCHGQINSFDMVRSDYNSDGVIEGVQTEVQKLLNKLSTLLPNSAYQANSNNYVADGLVKTSVSYKTNWPAKFLKAGYNWQFVQMDGSKGVHNAPFAVGLLRASIGDLTGDANNDGLADAWQIQYFGSATNAAAAPNAMPVGDGVPNWMKYLLGLNPLVPGISVTNGLSVGVVWADGSSLNNPFGATNTVQIYTAAEVVFNTDSNKTYQVQAASSVSSGWQNVGYPIPGTGQAVSYVTPTRKDVQQFYRVYSY
jgi:predicted CXXCH cytochrome family protein